MAILEVKDLTKDFGGLRAVSHVDLNIHEGEILGLIGPNGSGKTTMYNLITGFLVPTAGQVIYQGESITGLKPHEIAARGLARTFQIPSMFPNLTVKENVIAGRHLEAKDDAQWSIFNTRNYRAEKAKVKQEAMEILAFMGLEQVASVLARNLPYGYQRNLEIAIALALKPKLLLLDEPATGMNPEETTRLIDLIQIIHQERGIALVVVEHHMEVIMRICNRIAVLDYGVKIAEGRPEEVAQNPEVIAIYLGRRKEHA